jgi:hypothetical protein
MGGLIPDAGNAGNYPDDKFTFSPGQPATRMNVMRIAFRIETIDGAKRAINLDGHDRAHTRSFLA